MKERGTRTFVHQPLKSPVFLAASLQIVHVSTLDAQTARVACLELIWLMQRRISSFCGPCSHRIFATNRFPTCFQRACQLSSTSPSPNAWSIRMQPHSLAVMT